MATGISSSLRLIVQLDASFVISVGEVPWLYSAPFRVFTRGAWHDLTESVGTQVRAGEDEMGAFNSSNTSWRVDGMLIFTTVKVYATSALFIQEAPNGLPGTNASYRPLRLTERARDLDTCGTCPPIVAYPAFRASAGLLPNLGYVLWSGAMAELKVGVNATARLNGLATSGPVALVDDQYRSLVVSPLDNFKSALHARSAARGAWECDVSSELTSLPAGFSHRTILVAGKGVTATMTAWGR